MTVSPRRYLLSGAVALIVIGAALTVPAGPAQAVANPYRNQGVSANDASSPKDAVASCTGNDRLVGMGAKIEGGQGEVLLTGMVPDLATDSVTATGVENVAVGTAWQAIAWAICAPVGTEPANLAVEDDVAVAVPASPKTVDAQCQGNSIVYSVGFILTEDDGKVAIDEVEFDPAFTSGSVTAYTNNGLAGSWGLQTYVICGAPSPNPSLQTWTSARNSITPKTETTPVCGGTTEVHGVGAVIDGARGDASITTLNPRPQLTTGEATVREIGTTTDNWEMEVQAFCSD